jgi:hypothetical protein
VEEQEPAAEVRVDGRVAVARSTIHGQGLFAAGDIAAGEVVVRLGGRLVSSAVLDELLAAAAADPGAAYVDTVQVAEDVHLVLPPGTKGAVAVGLFPAAVHLPENLLARAAQALLMEPLPEDDHTHAVAAGESRASHEGPTWPISSPPSSNPTSSRR